MRPNQVYKNGIITNSFKSQRSKILTFTVELITLAVVLAVVVALAIVLQ